MYVESRPIWWRDWRRASRRPKVFWPRRGRIWRAKEGWREKSACLFHLVTIGNGRRQEMSHIYIYITRFPDYRIPSTTATATGPLNGKCSGGGVGERKTWNVNLIASPFSATTSYQSSAPREPPPPSSCQLFLERTEANSRWSSRRRTALRRAWMPRTLG